MNIPTSLLITLIVFIVLFFAGILYVVYRLGKKDPSQRYVSKYPSTYICADGDKARSLSEVLIDNFFFKNGIEHKAEDVIVKSGNGPKYKYDFYLPRVDVYVEFFGYRGKKYFETRLKKEKFYKKHKLTMIAIIPSDLADLERSLKDKFAEYWDKIAVEKHCPGCGASLDRRF